MDTVEIFSSLARASLLVMPLAVVYLAFRRLSLSRSGNAWIYAVTGLLAFVTTLGLLPWATLGLPTSPVLIGVAFFLPLLWVAVVLICGPGQGDAYDLIDDEPEKLPPLILENPRPVPVPVFRHRPVHKASLPKHGPTASGSVLAAARAMRGNRTSDERRPKALPPPMPVLPFLKS